MKSDKTIIFGNNFNIARFSGDIKNFSNNLQTVIFKSNLTENEITEIVNDSTVKLVILNQNRPISVFDNLNLIRSIRKDIFLVVLLESNKTIPKEQYSEALNLLKTKSCNLVFSYNIWSSLSMVVVPEEAVYYVDFDCNKSLSGLFEILNFRVNLTFTRSKVVDGNIIPWDSNEIPQSFKTIIDYCIENNAYKPFNNSTAGHFAIKKNNNTFLTSIRRTNFNNIESSGLVKVVTEGRHNVIAYGAKPSVGGQSQRIIFEQHPDLDCILHFHCPIKSNSKVPIASQKEYECGSHECGLNTSKNLGIFDNLHAVYLDNHGPNIVFNSNINPQEVISFVNDNFDLSNKAGEVIFN